MYIYIYIYIFLTTCTSIVHHMCICMFFLLVCIYNIMGSCLKYNIIIYYYYYILYYYKAKCLCRFH